MSLRAAAAALVPLQMPLLPKALLPKLSTPTQKIWGRKREGINY